MTAASTESEGLSRAGILAYDLETRAVGDTFACCLIISNADVDKPPLKKTTKMSAVKGPTWADEVETALEDSGLGEPSIHPADS